VAKNDYLILVKDSPNKILIPKKMICEFAVDYFLNFNAKKSASIKIEADCILK
jgi:hypothetical protein